LPQRLKCCRRNLNISLDSTCLVQDVELVLAWRHLKVDDAVPRYSRAPSRTSAPSSLMASVERSARPSADRYPIRLKSSGPFPRERA
jgi:hypothetical protein